MTNLCILTHDQQVVQNLSLTFTDLLLGSKAMLLVHGQGITPVPVTKHLASETSAEKEINALLSF